MSIPRSSLFNVALLLPVILFATLSSLADEASSPTTTAAPRCIATIALLGDPHVSPEARYAEYVSNFDQVIDQVNAANVDAVLIAGDLMQSAKPDAFRAFKEMSARLQPRVWFVPGNHDVGDKPLPNKPTTVTDAKVAQFEQKLGPAFFAEQILPGVRIIGITSSLLGSGTAREHQQWEFLEKELSRPRDGVTLLLTHYPPFAVTSDEPDAYFNMNGPQRLQLKSLLNRGGVKLILSAHLHLPIDHDWEGIHIIGTPAISFGLPEGQQKSGWTLVKIYDDGHASAQIHYLEKITRQPTTSPSGSSATTRSSHAAELLHAQSSVCDRVHIFYYDWYGAPPLESGYLHWQQGQHTPPDDIGSNFYPALGPYSSSDPKVLRQQMAWIKEAHVGVLSLSWWGQNSYEDRRVQGVLDAAAEAGIKVNFHIEPYVNRSPAMVVKDVAYLLDRYGSHPAFYRAQTLGNRPLFYVFESLRDPAKSWRPALEQLHGASQPPLLIAQTTDLDFIRDAGFDGGYPYDVLTPFKNPSFLQSWNRQLKSDFADAGKLFIPSVGPGYWDDRAVPVGGADEPEAARTRDAGEATTYDAAWRAAIDTSAPIITITSFNEWHEGSQIEPAIDKPSEGYHYPAYSKGPLQFIHLTAQWVDRFAGNQPPASPRASDDRRK